MAGFEKQSPLPQFMILVYEREVPESATAASPTVLEAHMHLPRMISETGGRTLAGHALRPASAAVSIRDNVAVDGSLSSTAGRRSPATSSWRPPTSTTPSGSAA